MFVAVAVASAALLAVRAVLGPLSWMHSPLNAECALAISVIAALLVARPRVRTLEHPDRTGWLALPMIFLAALIAFLPILSMPLITDDYTHMRQISSGEAPKPLACLTQACGGPHVFRPLPFATFWGEWQLWGRSAMPRHAFDLILHGFTSVLFLLLVRELEVAPPFDWLAGLLFAWNGIRPEAVAWPGARFDTLALLFSLSAAIGALRGGWLGFSVSLLVTTAACLSKESAYVLPLLLAILLSKGVLTRAHRILIGSNLALTGAIFMWRWWALKGIGGYVGPDGTSAMVYQFHTVSVLKSFLWRIWGILAFPINWSTPLEWWMTAGLLAGVIATLLLLGSHPNRKHAFLCLAGVAVACVPPYNMLLIDSSLERSRYLDLATPAFTLLLVLACVALPRRAGFIALGLLGFFHLAALEHNLQIWKSVSTARYEVCRGLAQRARTASGQITVDNVPLVVDGVYWRNGIEDCLWLEFGVPMGKVLINQERNGMSR